MGTQDQSERRISVELLDRYLAGECSDAERTHVMAWMSATPSRTLDEAFRLGVGVSSEQVREALGRVQRLVVSEESATSISQDVHRQTMADAQTLQSRPHSGNAGVRERVRGAIGGLGPRTLRAGLWTPVVAAVIGAVVISIHRVDSPSIETRIYATHSSQQAVINLDDSSRVTLAPQTTLRVLELGQKRRAVALERGEAYFEVSHASEIPFIVRSGTVTAQVLGTAFLVRNRDNQHVRVAVTDGKVRVVTHMPGDTGITLTMGQIGEVMDSTQHLSTTDDLTPGTEWAPGRIMFRDTPLSTVLKTVSRWYGYQFRYADKTLSARSVTIIVSTRSSSEALAEIERVLAVNLTVVGDTVTLVPQPRRATRSIPRIRTYDVWTPAREVGR